MYSLRCIALRVKICGITRSKDLNAALNYGADAVGFVVDSPLSRRNLSLSKARDLLNRVSIFTTTVAVTSTQSPRNVLKICSQLKPDAIQLHQHTRGIVRKIRKKYPETQLILATPIRYRSSVTEAVQTSNYSDAVLADTPGPSHMGGTGRSHDWELTASLRDTIYPHPLILAGGLTPYNVRAAIRKVRPSAVDVSTGVEKTIGIKDHKKIKDFIENAKAKMN